MSTNGLINFFGPLLLVVLILFLTFKMMPFIINAIRCDTNRELDFLLECRMKRSFMYGGMNKKIPFVFLLFYFILFSLCVYKDITLLIPLSLLCVMSLLDIRINIVPDFISYLFIWSGILFAALHNYGFQPVYSVVICYLFFYILNKMHIGMNLADGDLKIIAGAGAWFGYFVAGYLLILLMFLSVAHLLYRRKQGGLLLPGIPIINLAVFFYILLGNQLH